MVGDKVSLDYMQVTGRGGTILQAMTVKLEKAGPDTLRLESPVEVQIVETGRTGIIVRLIKENKQIRFTRHRKTEMLPLGWTPSAGEKAKIHFEVKSATWTFGINYQANKVEQVD